MLCTKEYKLKFRFARFNDFDAELWEEIEGQKVSQIAVALNGLQLDSMALKVKVETTSEPVFLFTYEHSFNPEWTKFSAGSKFMASIIF